MITDRHGTLKPDSDSEPEPESSHGHRGTVSCPGSEPERSLTRPGLRGSEPHRDESGSGGGACQSL
eukprot:1710841-Rhodomonas_salina.1